MFKECVAKIKENIIENKKVTYSLLHRLMEKELIKRISSNIYSCVNPATGEVIASRYQMACASSSSAHIYYHTRFEYYGFTNLISDEAGTLTSAPSGKLSIIFLSKHATA